MMSKNETKGYSDFYHSNLKEKIIKLTVLVLKLDTTNDTKLTVLVINIVIDKYNNKFDCFSIEIDETCH